MASIQNIGSGGIVVDHPSSNTLPNYVNISTVNWRFSDLNARITDGFSNALATRDPDSLTKNGTWFVTFEESTTENVLYYADVDSQLRRVSISSFLLTDRLVDNTTYLSGSFWSAFSFFNTKIFNNGTVAPFTIDTLSTTFSTTPTSTLITVVDTTGFPASGTIFIGSGTFTYASKTATTFVGTGFPTNASEGTVLAAKKTTLTDSVKTDQLHTLETALVAVGYNNNKREFVVTNGATSTGTNFTLPSWSLSGGNGPEDRAILYNISDRTSGDIVGALPLSNRLMIYTNHEVLEIALDDIAGSNRVTIDRPHNDNGLLAPRAVCNIPNKHFVIGISQIYTTDGNTKELIGEGRWKEEFFQKLNKDRLDELQTTYDPSSNSVWIKLPTDDTSIEMWIVDLDSKTLSILDDHSEVKYMTFSDQGLPGSSGSLTYADLEEGSGHPLEGVTYEDVPGTNTYETLEAAKGAYEQRILSIGDKKIFVHDYGDKYNGRTITPRLRFQDKYGGSSSKFVSRITPFFKGVDGIIKFKVGGRDNTVQPIVFDSSIDFELGVDDWADCRTSRKFITIELEGGNSGTIMNEMEVDIQESGI